MKTFISAGAALGFICVLLGAMGAHALKNVLSVEELASFQTGVRYLMYHAIILVVLGLFGKEKFKLPAQLFLIGSVLFSFSIFIILLLKHVNFPYTWLGPVTPIGGTVLLVGWLILFARSIKK
jgi:uncharacterized membrane protein YgdD (TMEM256/DUF423 family)